jgi:hypothetical protein
MFIGSNKIDCYDITLEPGDMTRYRFFIIIEKNDFNSDNHVIHILSDNKHPNFKLVSLHPIDIISFFKTYGEPPFKNDYFKVRESYLKKNLLSDSFFNHIKSVSGNNNPWTNVAGLMAGYLVLKKTKFVL